MHLRRTSALVTAAALALATVPLAAAPASAAGPDYLFDFQCAGNPTAPGYTAVYANTAYSASTGFGFATPMAANQCRDRGGSDPALNDFVLPAVGSTFLADVPDGTYTVILRTGDAIATSNTGATVGGIAVPARRADAGVIDERVVDGVQVTGGQLSIVLSGSSTRLNSIQILQPVAAPTGRDRRGDGDEQRGVRRAVVGRRSTAPPGTGSTGPRRAARPSSSGRSTRRPRRPGPTPTSSSPSQYTYAVSTVGSTGRESVRSAEVSATVVDPAVAPPAVPTGCRRRVGRRRHRADLGRRRPVRSPTTCTARGRGSTRSSSRGPPTGPGPTRPRRRPSTTSTASRPSAPAVARRPPPTSRSRGPCSTCGRPSGSTGRRSRSPTDGGVYLGWRQLGLDPDSIAFHVYRDGASITTTPVTTSTNLLDAGGTAARSTGSARWSTASSAGPPGEFRVWDSQHLDVPLDKPADAYTQGRSAVHVQRQRRLASATSTVTGSTRSS